MAGCSQAVLRCGRQRGRWVRRLRRGRGTGGLGAAAVYDGVGRDTFEKSLRVLAVRGALVLFGQSSGPVPPFDLARLGQAGSLIVTRPTLRDFVATPAELRRRSNELWEWLSQGRLKVRVDRTFQLADASLAHDELQDVGAMAWYVTLPGRECVFECHRVANVAVS